MLAEIKPGTSINSRYVIQKLLGQGGFGRTYLATDTQRFGEPCVLKEFVPTTKRENLIRKSRELFEREAKILYQINHAQIPRFLAWMTSEERLFIVQEYIDGKTYSQLLYERLSSRGEPFSESEVIQWLLDLLPVLDHIHQQNIIHRDISLDNVMLSYKQSKPVLIDFGVVKEKITQIFSPESNNAHHSVRSSMVGKIGYSPPEQILLGYCYPCSDIYALGVCAVVLLTGKMPDVLVDRQSLQWQWTSYVNISSKFGKILEKMLVEQPSQRYQSAKEILHELYSTPYGYELTNEPTQLIVPGNFTPRTLRDNFRAESADVVPKDDFRAESPIISIDPEFLQRCRQELTSFVGPFASVILEDTLAEFPDLTPEELIEALVAEIPHQQRAEEFRKRMQK
ncbi:MAG: serine/threonine-protein kinase [Scytonema sp. PMC 1069.18]|nr:serine/threonine-protein kinase [Scytonema sp. PMC 1069.18]MEC4884432.1 serine/threonine-protein kinase [Scytonema sp. PMC 1070.18]